MLKGWLDEVAKVKSSLIRISDRQTPDFKYGSGWQITKVKKLPEVDAKNGHFPMAQPWWWNSTDFKDDEILFSAYSLGGSSLYGQADDVSADMATAVMSLSGIGDFDKISLDKLMADKKLVSARISMN
jgi:zinc protease